MYNHIRLELTKKNNKPRKEIAHSTPLTTFSRTQRFITRIAIKITMGPAQNLWQFNIKYGIDKTTYLNLV